MEYFQRKKGSIFSLFPSPSIYDDEFHKLMKRPVLVQIQWLEKCKIKLDGFQREKHSDVLGLNYTHLKINLTKARRTWNLHKMIF